MKMNVVERCFVNSRLYSFLYTRFFLLRFFRWIDVPLHGRMLELGCGIGVTTEALLRTFPHITTALGMDIDPHQIRLADQRQQRSPVLQKKAHFLRGDALRLSFPKETFHVVFELNAFHHIAPFTKAIHEAARVLRRNGHFFAVDVNALRFGCFFRWFDRPESLFSLDEFCAALEANGMQVKKKKDGFFFFVLAEKK